MLFASSRCCFLGLVLITSRLWGSIRLRPFVFFLDSFFFLAGFQARWPYPRNHYYLCYASLLALLLCQCYDAYHLLVSLPNCHEPLTFDTIPSKPLFGYVTALLSPSYSVASCRWRLEFVPCWNMFVVGISLLYLDYFNAPIYLVKGGRLGLMPGVLFHSCRPSFRHTGVMFPDFAFLTRLGDLWDPLDSSLWIKLLQQGPTLVLPFAPPPPIPFPWVGQPCWKYALEAIINGLLLYFLVHDNCLLFML